MKSIQESSEERVTPEDWITVEDAVKISGKSIKTIYRYIKAGKLSKLDDYTIKGGRKYLVRKKEVEALLKPLYAIERLRSQDGALVKQEQALQLIRDAQRGILDTIENTRTEMRTLSTIARKRHTILVIITAFLIVSFAILTVKLIRQQRSWRDAWTYMTTYVQGSQDRQEELRIQVEEKFGAQKSSVDTRIGKLEKEIGKLREEKARRDKKEKRKRFLGIF